MDNNKILYEIFSNSLNIALGDVNEELTYQSIPEWDSVAHMVLVAGLEEGYDIMLDTDDIIDMNSVENARDILKKYSITF